MAIRIFTAVIGAKAIAAAGDAVTKKAFDAVGQRLGGVLDEVSEHALLASGGVFDIDGKPLLDLSKLTTSQKGSLGELLGENTVKKIIPDGEKLARAPAIGETGLDDLYKINKPNVDYVVIEYKFVGSGTGKGSTRLGETLDGTQVSNAWVLGGSRLERSVGDDVASAVKDAILLNRTETWVVTTRPDGSSIVEVLDSLVKTKSVDTSKILSGIGNISGALP